jgi:hypothetical protein
MQHGTALPIDHAYSAVFIPCDTLVSHLRGHNFLAGIYGAGFRVYDNHFGAFLAFD